MKVSHHRGTKQSESKHTQIDASLLGRCISFNYFIGAGHLLNGPEGGGVVVGGGV